MSAFGVVALIFAGVVVALIVRSMTYIAHPSTPTARPVDDPPVSAGRASSVSGATA